MAYCAAFAKRQMLVHERPTLLFVTFKTELVRIFHRSSRPGPRIRPMRIMAIRAGHVAFQDWMTMRELEFGFLFHVAGKTHFRILAGIDDLNTLAAAGIHVQAPGTVTHLATFYFNSLHRNGNSFVSGKLEIPDLLLMAHGAGLGPDVLSTLHLIIFHDLLESFNIHITAGRKERKTGQNKKYEEYFFKLHY